MNENPSSSLSFEFRLGVWTVTPTLNRVVSRQRTFRLEPKVMEVLAYLALRAGEVVAKGELMRVVWTNTYVTNDSVKRCVSILRKVLKDDTGNPQIIETISKRGYRLTLPVFKIPQSVGSVNSNLRRHFSRG
jgi:DNA-binding winged helix-turn-helix (wHTH) protein